MPSPTRADPDDIFERFVADLAPAGDEFGNAFMGGSIHDDNRVNMGNKATLHKDH